MVLTGGTGGLTPSGLISAVSGSFGIAVLLRMLGGAAMVRGMMIVAVEATAPVADAVRLPSMSGGSVAIDDPPTAQAHRLDVHHERLAMVGLVLVAASYLFDGHTVTATPALLVHAASAIHVAAAGVWVGGVLLMAWTLTGRHRRGVELDAAAMVIRFSRVASFALVVVAVAGTILAFGILDTPAELLTTSWGRILIIKLIAVAIAGAIGAYNHFVTVPSLAADPTDPGASERLRSLVRIEGAILLVVVVITAILVGAAS